MSIELLKAELQRLNRQEQAELMHFMVELLATDNFQLTNEWKKELDRRAEALNNDTSVGRSAIEVLKKYTSKSK